jgi:hypothetical protein
MQRTLQLLSFLDAAGTFLLELIRKAGLRTYSCILSGCRASEEAVVSKRSCFNLKLIFAGREPMDQGPPYAAITDTLTKYESFLHHFNKVV